MLEGDRKLGNREAKKKAGELGNTRGIREAGKNKTKKDGDNRQEDRRNKSKVAGHQ